MKRRCSLLTETAPGAGLGALLRRIAAPLGRRSLAGGALEHLGTLALTAQASLALVRLGNETLLLGITAQNISVLARNDEVIPAAKSSGARGGDNPPQSAQTESE